MITFMPRDLYRDILAWGLEEEGMPKQEALIEANRRMDQMPPTDDGVLLIKPDGEGGHVTVAAKGDPLTTTIFGADVHDPDPQEG